MNSSDTPVIRLPTSSGVSILWGRKTVCTAEQCVSSGSFHCECNKGKVDVIAFLEKTV